MQISSKLIRGINHAKSTVCIKFQFLVTFSSLFTASSSLCLSTKCTVHKSILYTQARIFAPLTNGVIRCLHGLPHPSFVHPKLVDEIKALEDAEQGSEHNQPVEDIIVEIDVVVKEEEMEVGRGEEEGAGEGEEEVVGGEDAVGGGEEEKAAELEDVVGGGKKEEEVEGKKVERNDVGGEE